MIASVGQVSAQAPHETQAESRKPASMPGGDVRVEAAAGGGQRERALDLVARAHAAPARDAQLVLEGEVGVAACRARRRASRPVQRGSPTPSARATGGQLGVRRRAARAARRARARRRRSATRRGGRVARCRRHARRGTASCTRATGPARALDADEADAAGAERRHGARRSRASAPSARPRGRRRARSSPGSTSTRDAVDRDAHHAQPQLVGEVRRAGCGSAPACRRRARRG